MQSRSNKVVLSTSVPDGLTGLRKLRLGVTSFELSDIDVVYASVEKMGMNFGRYITDQLDFIQYSEDDMIRIYSRCKKNFINTYSNLIFENLNKISDRRTRNKCLRNLVRIADSYEHPPF